MKVAISIEMMIPVGPKGRPINVRSISSSPPKPLSTRVKQTAPMIAPKMNAVVLDVSSMTSLTTGRLRAPFDQARSIAPAAPTPAASVGVANPKKILPRTASIKKAAGTMALKSIHTAARSTG